MKRQPPYQSYISAQQNQSIFDLDTNKANHIVPLQ